VSDSLTTAIVSSSFADDGCRQWRIHCKRVRGI